VLWRVAISIALLAPAIPGAAQGGEPLWSAGAFHFRWRTTDGRHGHIADCRTEACDRADLARGNLDNAFGLRLGLEAPVTGYGAFRLLAGVEGQVLFTEYNLSQRDVTIGELDGVLGGALDLGPIELLVRTGAGGVLNSGGRGGLGRFVEGAIGLPVHRRISARVGFRRAWHAGPSTDEVSLSVLLRPREAAGHGRWNIGWSVGASRPGALVGDDLSLSAAPAWELSVFRMIGESPYRLGLGIGSTGQESAVRTVRGDVPGNQRGKEIFDLTLLADRSVGRTGGIRWRAGLGVRVARWRDRDSLLLDAGGSPVDAGTEAAGLASLAARLEIGESLGLVGRAEQVYWPSLGLGEVRVMLGLEAGASEPPPRPVAPGRAFSADEGPPFLKRLAVDFGDFWATGWHMNARRWRSLGWGSAAVAGAFLVDNEVRSAVQRARSRSSDRLVDDLRPLGNQVGALGVIGLIWLGGRVAGDADAEAIGEDALEATIFSGFFVVPALKAAVGRARPDARLGHAHFEPFSGADAFPSGEAAQAFTIASVVAGHARAPWVKIAGWGLAGVLAYGRVHLDRHWTSDVVAGGLIGAAIGSWVAARRGRGRPADRGSPRVTVLPAPGGIEVRGFLSW